jgi:hypothetical protein
VSRRAPRADPRGGAAQAHPRAEPDVGADRADVGVDVGRGRSGHRHPGPHERLVDPSARGGVDRRQIDAVVDARDLLERRVDRGGATAAGGPRHQIGQVQLALGVVGLEGRQVATQVAQAHRVEAGVGVLDRPLGLAGVGVLDDALQHAGGVADQATVGHGPIGHGRQERQAGRAGRARRDQLVDALGAQERRVARQDHDDAIVGLALEGRQRAQDGVAGALGLGLQRDVDRARAVATIEHGLHGVELVAEDRDHALGAGGARGLDRPRDHRAASDLVEHLGALALHAGAQAGGHDQHDRMRTTHRRRMYQS